MVGAGTRLGLFVVAGLGFAVLGGCAGSGDGGETLDCGNAGTAMRLLIGALAGRPATTTLIGDESLSGRPMERVAAPLRSLGAQVTRYHRIEQSHFDRLCRSNQRAAAHHFDGSRNARKPGHSLRTSGSREQTEFHFGQADFGRIKGHPVMTAKGHLETAAKRSAMNCGHD